MTGRLTDEYFDDDDDGKKNLWLIGFVAIDYCVLMDEDDDDAADYDGWEVWLDLFLCR